MYHPEPLSPPRARTGLRWLRIVALIGLALGFSFLVDLALLAVFPQSHRFMDHLLNGGLPTVRAAVLPALTLVYVTLFVCGYAAWRLWARPSYSVVGSGLMVATVLVLDLLVMAFIRPGITDPLTDLLSTGHLSDLAWVVALVGFIPLIVFGAVCRLCSWRCVLVGYVALVPTVSYLAIDDPRITRPITLAEVSPAFPGSEASYNVLMRYGKAHPLGKNFREPKRIFATGPFVDASKPAEWSAWLARHRPAIEADWSDLTPVRAWVDELNSYKLIGDLMPAQPGAEIISFAPFRSYTHHVCEIAGLQALAGHGDEAMATLLPLLQVGRKLEPSSRSLVRSMTARVMQNLGLSAARFVLDTTAVSPAMRAQLAASLELGIGGEEGVRHLLAVEDSFLVEASADQPLGDFLPQERARSRLLRWSLNLASPFVYNRCRTVNLHGELTANLQALAARRDMTGLVRAQSVFSGDRAQPTFKNYMGNFLIGAMVPAYTKVVETYWKIEDSRTTLLAQLRNPQTGVARN
jgi:hypothetical protein